MLPVYLGAIHIHRDVEYVEKRERGAKITRIPPLLYPFWSGCDVVVVVVEGGACVDGP